MIPDIKAAIIERLLTSVEITALVDGRIGSAHRKSWGKEPGYMILVRLSGTPGEAQWREVGMQSTRIDFEFYGSTPEEATELWRTAHPILCPLQGQGLNSFTQSNCRVSLVDKEAGPFELIDPDSDLYFTMASYVFVWHEVPVNV